VYNVDVQNVVILKSGLGVTDHWNYMAPLDRLHTSSYSSSIVKIYFPPLLRYKC